LSAKEVERIKEFLCSGRKADVKDFAVAEPNDKIFVRELRRLLPGYPVSEVFQTSGSHWRLKTAGNDCVFLTKSGCLLPRECRPLYCRLFPFWIFGGKIVLMDAVNCLGAHEAVSVQEALKLFRVSADEISALFHHMMISWGLK
jgi:Fe-S-cluster containining protein